MRYSDNEFRTDAWLQTWKRCDDDVNLNKYGTYYKTFKRCFFLTQLIYISIKSDQRGDQTRKAARVVSLPNRLAVMEGCMYYLTFVWQVMLALARAITSRIEQRYPKDNVFLSDGAFFSHPKDAIFKSEKAPLFDSFDQTFSSI